MVIFERLNTAGKTIIISTHDSALVDIKKKRVIEFGHTTIQRDETPGKYYKHD